MVASRQDSRGIELASRQQLERLVTVLQREGPDGRPNRDECGELEELASIGPGEIGHAAQAALQPQEVVRELGDPVEVNCVDGDRPTSSDTA